MEVLYLLIGLMIVLLMAILIGIFWGRRQMNENLLIEVRSLREVTQDRISRLESTLPNQFSQNRQELTHSLYENRQEMSTSLENLRSFVVSRLQEFQQSVDSIAKTNREEVGTLRSELTSTLNTLTKDLNDRIQNLLSTLTADLKNFEQTIQQESRNNRTELNTQLQGFQKTLSEETKNLRTVVDQKITDLSKEVSSNLKEIKESNEKELEKVRNLVSTELASTLQTKIQDSFTHLVESLSQVHKDLGEMQILMQEVGDLKRVLTNVKHRGILGEAQLETLLENILPGLYQKQFEIGEGKVDFAIQMPAPKDHSDQKQWLPIDAKFSKEDFESLLNAYESGDNKKIEEAIKKFRSNIQEKAKKIQKYIDPPKTTEYAIMFLPTESLYAEVVKDQTFFEGLYRDFRVLVTGPSTLIALLNSLRVGFRTIAIEQKTQHVLKVLGAIKTEFDKFAKVLEQAQEKIQEADKKIEELVGTRTRQIQRKLRQVEELPELSSEEARQLLELPEPKSSNGE